MRSAALTYHFRGGTNGRSILGSPPADASVGACVRRSVQAGSGVDGLLFYPRIVNAGTEDEGVVHEMEHFLEKTEAEAIATMRAWVENAFGPGVRMKLMPPDEPDYR